MTTAHNTSRLFPSPTIKACYYFHDCSQINDVTALPNAAMVPIDPHSPILIIQEREGARIQADLLYRKALSDDTFDFGSCNSLFFEINSLFRRKNSLFRFAGNLALSE
jgi:hypothetical protein